jgi:fructose-1,6-bisphosphatase/inositol monophosphatase family enzyme
MTQGYWYSSVTPGPAKRLYRGTRTMNTDNLDEMLEKRLSVMSELAVINTQRIYDFMHLPKEERMAGSKRDRTVVTRLDYETNLQTMTKYLVQFPEDSFDGEEIHMLRKGSTFTLLEDPVDNTDHVRHFDQSHPEKKRWATYMLGLMHKGEPVAFAFGVALRKELYWGRFRKGVVLNGRQHVPKPSPGIIVGVNEESHSSTLKELTGHENVRIAGFCAWLILQGMTAGGICPFHLPHESTCIAAAALSMGAMVSNIHGGEFQPYNEQAQLVWAFPPLTLEEVISHHRA